MIKTNKPTIKTDTTNFTIRPFAHTETDYADWVKIFNQHFTSYSTTVEIWKEHFVERKPNYLKEMIVGELDINKTKQIVATGCYAESDNQKKSGKYHIEVWIDQEFEGQGLHEPLYKHLVDFLADKNPTQLLAFVKENMAQQIEFLRQNNFQQIFRETHSELDITNFDFAPFAGYHEKVAASGIEIITVKELQPRDANWMQKLCDLENAILQDIPRTSEFKPATLEKYAKKFKRPNLRTDAWFVAVDDEHYVGISSLWPNPVLKKILLVGITGVLPTHRRRGIATALKLKTIAFAQAYGAKIIETDNEENNPMYELNVKLGFQPTPGWLHFEKAL